MGQFKPTVEFNALADIELSQAGSASHYYYNEIDANNTDFRIGLSQLNLISKINLNSNWTVNGRVLMERNNGQKFDKLVFPQLNVQWLSKKRKYGITLGSFINPFGSFNEKQLSTERDFIGLPLAYSYYVNVSDVIGFVPNMGDIAKIKFEENVQWGSTNLYYGGYTTGGMFSWNIKPGKINWKLALVTGASNLQDRITNPLHFGLISRLKLQPKYFWKQGFSFSHGSFLRDSPFSESISDLRKYRQTLIGTDFNVGFGFLEFSGEIIAAFHKTPVFLEATGSFDPNTLTNPLNLSNTSFYLDTKYEMPFLTGSYVAFRIDRLGFGQIEGNYTFDHWDNTVWRQSFAIGYDLTQNILIRLAVSTQQVENKNWNNSQRTARLVITGHY
jgi:hypothetical protein